MGGGGGGKRGGPVVAWFGLFFIPSLLMGMVSPYSVKLNASSLAGVGGVAGRLYALSTFGSIAGTLLTTFFLIPSWALSNVLQFLGATELLVALGCLAAFLSARGSVTRSQINVVGVLALLWLMGVESWAAFPVAPRIRDGNRMLHYEDSAYHEIMVTEHVIYYEESTDRDGGTLLPCNSWYATEENTIP